MKKQQFIDACYPLACKAGELFNLNPVVILAQAALESGWGLSTLAVCYNNFFGITGSGSKNAYWPGHVIRLSAQSMAFRAYLTAEDGFKDYARLLVSAYPEAARYSYAPAAFAREMAASRYISEANGDDRQVYCNSLVSIAGDITRRLQKTK
ncbi:MAG: glucosaminidase domain-containing protein [Tannerellaceae bacterium]|nr:glucosaminidase domain-containing protein [Tannerellaceae bacterium]